MSWSTEVNQWVTKAHGFSKAIIDITSGEVGYMSIQVLVEANVEYTMLITTN